MNIPKGGLIRDMQIGCSAELAAADPGMAHDLTLRAALQKAAGSAFRASAFARSSMTGPRQSMAAASKAAAQAAQPDQTAAPGYPTEQQHPYTFTGECWSVADTHHVCVSRLYVLCTRPAPKTNRSCKNGGCTQPQAVAVQRCFDTLARELLHSCGSQLSLCAFQLSSQVSCCCILCRILTGVCSLRRPTLSLPAFKTASSTGARKKCCPSLTHRSCISTRESPWPGAGLPPAFWQSERAALKAAGLHGDPGASVSNPGKGSRSLDHHGTHMGCLSGRATPGLDTGVCGCHPIRQGARALV